MDRAQQHLNAALRYLNFGWSVIPLAAHNDFQYEEDKRGKRPLIKGWEHFCQESPVPEQIKQWLDMKPTPNIGVACGPASGVLVLDVDGEQGERSLDGKHLPLTPIVRSGSGGRHLYFCHPEGVLLRNAVKILPGLDVRTLGGQAVLPPSKHLNGNDYSWEILPDGLVTEDLRPSAELPVPPHWLLDLAKMDVRPQSESLQMAESYGNYLSSKTRDFLAIGAHEGERNDRLFTGACDMAGCGYSKQEAGGLLLEGARRSTPPLEERQAMQTVDSAFSQPRVPARPPSFVSQFPDQSAGLQTDTCKQQTDQSAHSQGPRQPGSEQFAAPKGGQQQHTTQPATRLTAGSLRKDYMPVTYQVEGILPLGGVCLWGGPPGIGKTFLGLDLAYGVATGTTWLDHFECSAGRVLLILEEEDPNSVKERLDLLYAGRGLSAEEGDTLPVEFLIQQGMQIVDRQGVLDWRLEEQIREFQPDLIIVDPLRRVHTLEENDSGAMSHLFSVLRQITHLPDNSCSVVVVHHTRKRNEYDGALDRLRGSSDIAASVDSVLEVSGQFEGTLTVKHTKSKRGPAIGTFMVQSDIREGSIRLHYLDPEEKANEDKSEGRAFVIRLLRENPEGLNQTALIKAGKPYGIGRSRIQSITEELMEKDGSVEIRQGPKNSKIYVLVDQFAAPPAPPAANCSEPDQEQEYDYKF